MPSPEALKAAEQIFLRQETKIDPIAGIIDTAFADYRKATTRLGEDTTRLRITAIEFRNMAFELIDAVESGEPDAVAKATFKIREHGKLAPPPTGEARETE